jgi:hypothetical protein
VTVLRVLLGAHNRNPKHADSMPKPLEASSEFLGLRDGVIANVTALVIEILVIRPSAELAAQEHVLHAGSLKRMEERFAVEPWRMS